jgi:hypothetical protein
METLEIWKDIEWYKWKYQVSNLWRVKSLERILEIKWHKRINKERILKNNTNTNWYYHVSFNILWIRKNYLVHRLQAIYFIENKLNLPYVNHKDWNKQNNCIENLEWCTQKENVRHAWKNWLNKVSENNCFIKNHPHKWLLWKNHFNSKNFIWKYKTIWDFSI